jgi:enolase
LSAISSVFAREVLDSRGKPTVEVEVRTDDDVCGRAIVPSGASTGKAEALELRDGDSVVYDGDGVRKAVAHVNDIIGPAVENTDVVDQNAIDEKLLELDGTPQKTNLGGNAILGVSMAVAHAGAAAKRVPLYRHFHDLLGLTTSVESSSPALPREPRMPLPMTNMISGGLHAGGNLDIQDVLIMPVGAPNYRSGLEWLVRVYRRLGSLLNDAGYDGRLVGDEGGYGPRLESNGQALEFVVRAIEAANLRPRDDVTIALDIASSHFYRDGTYDFASEEGNGLTSGDMIELLADWVDQYPIASIEDGLDEDDWGGWQQLTARLGDRVQLVGDDLFATNEHRVRRGIEEQAGNSVLVKMNQIGTISETFHTIHVARSAGYSIVVSARSGETEDTTIADLAVGVAADFIKIGSVSRSERLAKYNQLLRIEEVLSAE